jgi:hypothetical protein
MKTLTFEQMEQANGGRCGKQGWIALGSVVATIGAAPSVVGMVLGATLTTVAIYDYWDCLGMFE